MTASSTPLIYLLLQFPQTSKKNIVSLLRTRVGGGKGKGRGTSTGEKEKGECRMKEGRKGGEGQDDLLKLMVLKYHNSDEL